MRREEYRGSDVDPREYGRDFDREDYNRSSENRGSSYNRDFESRGRSDRDYERNFGGRERGFGRDFDEDRGFGYGRQPGNMGYSNYGGYAGEGVYGQNWGGRNYGQYPQGQRFYGQRNDQEIEHEVYDRLDNEWQIPDNADIHVQVKEGVVTLTGKVRNRNAKMAAWNCVWQVPGVEDVHNNVEIQSRRRQNQSQGMFSGTETGQAGQSPPRSSGTETTKK